MPNDDDHFSDALFIVQQIAAPVSSLFLGLIAVELVDQLTGTRNHRIAPWFCYALVGFAQGYLMQTLIPRSYRSGGSFVWILPVALLLVLTLTEYRRGLSAVMTEFLVWNPYSFAKGFISTFITMPALASCFYSLGITAAAHRSATTSKGNI